jgi:hypothetical protein
MYASSAAFLPVKSGTRCFPVPVEVIREDKRGLLVEVSSDAPGFAYKGEPREPGDRFYIGRGKVKHRRP